jgi:hypothetical protein
VTLQLPATLPLSIETIDFRQTQTGRDIWVADQTAHSPGQSQAGVNSIWGAFRPSSWLSVRRVCPAQLGITIDTRPAHVGFAITQFGSDIQPLSADRQSVFNSEPRQLSRTTTAPDQFGT